MPPPVVRRASVIGLVRLADGDSCWQDESVRRFSARWAHAQTQSDCKANCVEAYRCGLTHSAYVLEYSQFKETQ